MRGYPWKVILIGQDKLMNLDKNLDKTYQN